ncbi:MAG: cation:proton antiporter [Candidatus Latescibacteria bacterium]|nr:cation:proton antiporter [Candidatus Latescibacterota bacterium]
MPNLIGFLLFISAVLVGEMSDVAANPLIHLVLLVLLASFLTPAMRPFRLPDFIPAVLAGMVVGRGCLGLVHERFFDSMALIDAFFIMLVVAGISSVITAKAKPSELVMNTMAGLFMSLTAGGLAALLLLPTGLPFQSRVVFSLVAALFAPVSVFTLTGHLPARDAFTLRALGAFFGAVAIFGVAVPFTNPGGEFRIRIALMPLVLACTSLIAGMSWGFLSDKLLFSEQRKLNAFAPFAVLFLLYPCCEAVGLDFPFAAAGVGLYFGLLTERSGLIVLNSGIPRLIVFGFFGIALSREDVLSPFLADWKIVLVVAAIVMGARYLTSLAADRIFFRSNNQGFVRPLYLTWYGPLTAVAVQRFVPAISGQENLMPSGVTIPATVASVIIVSLAALTILHPLTVLTAPAESREPAEPDPPRGRRAPADTGGP